MLRLEYTPHALQDLQNIKEYIDTNYGTSAAQNYLKKLTKTARQLEQFPEEGIKLSQLLTVSTDYHYLVIKPNYLFYRLERDKVKVIRVLNEKQDFMQILFGISSVSDEGEEYWEESKERKNK